MLALLKFQTSTVVSSESMISDCISALAAQGVRLVRVISLKEAERIVLSLCGSIPLPELEPYGEPAAAE